MISTAQSVERENIMSKAVEWFLQEVASMTSEEVEGARIRQLPSETFHVQLNENNPYDGIDFKLTVTETEDGGYEFVIFDSVYGEDTPQYFEFSADEIEE